MWHLDKTCLPFSYLISLHTCFATTFYTFSFYSTWFFIAANPVLTFFVVWLAFRYGHLKLGDKNAKPEFSDVSYFAMIFSAGIGVGLFFFGVSEPLWHQSSHYYSNPGYRSQDEIDQWALLITMYHWGFAAWSPCKCTKTPSI